MLIFHRHEDLGELAPMRLSESPVVVRLDDRSKLAIDRLEHPSRELVTHQPTASRVVLEYVGRSINKREALSNCGLLLPESGAIPAAVLDYLNAPSPRSSIVLRAELP